MKLSATSIYIVDIIVLILTVVYAILLPRLMRFVACHSIIRCATCVLILALCLCVPQYGIMLALLLVLSTVPTLTAGYTYDDSVGNKEPYTSCKKHNENKAEDEVEEFANSPEKSKQEPSLLEQFTMAEINEKVIHDKMKMYEKARNKQHEFENKMEQIHESLKKVKEFYKNHSIGDKKNKMKEIKKKKSKKSK